MTLTLQRFSKSQSGVFSHLFDEQKNLIAVTLEHAYQDASGAWLPKITDGSHTCVRGTHQLHNGLPFETFEIMGIPGHSGLLFHCGNVENDSSGCVLLGTSLQGDMITESRKAFTKFLTLLDGVNSFDLVVC